MDDAVCILDAFHAGDKILLESLSVSGFIPCTLLDRINQHQSSRELLSENMLLSFLCLCLSLNLPSFFFFCFSCVFSYLCLISILSSPHCMSSFCLLIQPPSPPHSFQPPFATPLFHSLRKSLSLIWDMLDLVSLKATLLTPCMPLLRTAQAFKNSFTIRQALSVGMLLIRQLFPSYRLLMLPPPPPLPCPLCPLLRLCSTTD